MVQTFKWLKNMSKDKCSRNENVEMDEWQHVKKYDEKWVYP